MEHCADKSACQFVSANFRTVALCLSYRCVVRLFRPVRPRLCSVVCDFTNQPCQRNLLSYPVLLRTSSYRFLSSGGRQKLGHQPVRSTLPWRPAPLLCKRLNVPVPSALAELDWARKDGLFGGNHASPSAEQEPFQSVRKFVPDSSTVRPIKVGIVQHITTGSKNLAY